MSQEFSLLQHLGIHVSDGLAATTTTATRDTRERSYRVVAPCKCPPLKETEATGRSLTRHVPTAPLADFSGEVMPVKGKNNVVETEYLIYNARVPSIKAVNMQLAEERRRQRAAVAVARHASPDAPLIEDHSRDDMTRRRLLENLKRANMEQAQRRKEEKERERRQRMEREAAQAVKAITGHVEGEATTLVAQKQTGRRLEEWDASDEKWQQAVDVYGCVGAPQKHVLSQSERGERSRGREGERLIRVMTPTGDGVHVAQDSTPALERRELLEERRGGKSVAVDRNELCGDLFWHGRACDGHLQREKTRELMEANKRLAEERKRRQTEETALRIQRERQIMQETEDSYRKEMQDRLLEKRQKQEMLNKDLLEMAAQRESMRRSHTIESPVEDFFFHSREPRGVEERRQRERVYYDDLRRGIDSAREARLDEKRRVIADERRFLRETAVQAERDAERKQRKSAQKREEYRRTLEEQIRSKQGRERPKSPIPHSGPKVKVLYRCPVSGQLFPPEQFGVSSRRCRSSEWTF